MSKPEMELLLDGNRGIYLPKCFADYFSTGGFDQVSTLINVSDDDLERLKNGPDSVWYDEAWVNVLDHAVVVKDSGQRCKLHQSDGGDLWLVPEGMQWSDYKDTFVWPEDVSLPFIVKPDERDGGDEDFDPPSYREPGRVLFAYYPIPNEEPEIEIFDFDGSVFWLNESGFLDYWIIDNVTLELEGFYVLEGITGRAWKDSYTGEYDEEFEFELCRRASDEEIKFEVLFEPQENTEMSNTGWIAVDLDGTMAEYDHWRGPEHIGKPIPLMIDRVKRWLAEGQEVRIFTARVSGSPAEVAEAYPHIASWSLEQFGEVLEITCKKDYGMIQHWDDRCVQVIPNTGRTIADELESVRSALAGKVAKDVHSE